MPLPPNTLNQALNQLPQLLLSLGKLQQDRRDEELRRDIQQASQEFQREMLERRMAVSKELEQFRAGLEQPPEPRIIEDVAGRKRFAPEEGKPGELVFPEAKAPPQKGPSAGDIAYARRRRDVYLKTIDDANAKLEQMRRDLKISPGGQPKAPAGLGKKKEQVTLDNWNKIQKDLTKAQTSLDSLRRVSTERGIDLEFGAPAMPTPEDVSGMSDEEILRMMLEATEK